VEKFFNAFRVQGLVSGLQALGLKLSERLLEKSLPLIELDPGAASGISQDGITASRIHFF
jgi:hypothetical protein